MNVKKLALTAAVLFGAAGSTFAQNSDECLSNLSIYQEYYKQKNYKDAYLPWKAVMDNASCKHNMALYQKGLTILANLTVKETDAAKKKALFNELMALWDNRIQNLAQLNTTVRTKATIGDMYCRKAYDYVAYGVGVNNNTAYDMFRKGIDIIAQNDDETVQGFVLGKFFEVSYAKYQSDPENFREQFLKDYMECSSICEKMLAAANTETNPAKAQKIVEQYDPVQNNAEIMLTESKAADREQLLKIFTPKVESYKNDVASLRSVLTIMSSNNCADNETYYKAARYAQAIEPSYESAIGTAQYYNKMGKASEAAKYYDQALTLCNNDNQKSKIAYQVALAMLKSGDTADAEKYLTKAVALNSSLAGRCDLLRAQIHATNRNYDAAINYCDKASQEDIAISGQASRLKDKLQDAKAKKAVYDKQKAAADAAAAKRAKEDKFWNGGK